MSSERSGLHIRVDQDLSIDDLLAAKQAGISVARTPHAGNFSPYNLALAEAGIPIRVVDTNITNYDATYYPESVISSAGRAVLTDTQVVTSRYRIDGTDQYLDEFHIGGVREAIPGADVVSLTEYARMREEITEQVVKIASHDMPQLFQREVREDGTTLQSARAADLARSGRTLQLTDDPRAEQLAAMMPNEVNIVSFFASEALLTERDVQHHVSGPAMVQYAPKGRVNQQLVQLYGLAREKASFGEQLPADLEVILSDATDARFAVPVQEQSQMDAAIEAVDQHDEELGILNADKKAFFGSDSSRDEQQRGAFLAETRTRAASIDRDAAELVRPIAGSLVDADKAEPEQIRSQYGSIAEQGLYVPERMLGMSFAELRLLTRKMQKLVEVNDG